jgi:hypothetical protein
MLVDFLNNFDLLAEDQTQILAKLPNAIQNCKADELMKVTQQYGTGKTKRILKSVVRKALQDA